MIEVLMLHLIRYGYLKDTSGNRARYGKVPTYLRTDVCQEE